MSHEPTKIGAPHHAPRTIVPVHAARKSAQAGRTGFHEWLKRGEERGRPAPGEGRPDGKPRRREDGEASAPVPGERGTHGAQDASRRALREDQRRADDRRDDRLGPDADRRADERGLSPFQPPPSVLLSPSLSPATPAPKTAGSAAAHAETAAMAERLLDTLRIGRAADGSHQVRMRLSPNSRYAGVEVRLEEHGGELRASLLAEPGADARAAELADDIVRELRARGVDLTDVEIERA